MQIYTFTNAREPEQRFILPTKYYNYTLDILYNFINVRKYP